MFMSIIFCQQRPGEPIAAFHLLPIPHSALHIQKKSILPVRLWIIRYCHIATWWLSVLRCCLTARGSGVQPRTWPFCLELACPAIQKVQRLDKICFQYNPSEVLFFLSQHLVHRAANSFGAFHHEACLPCLLQEDVPQQYRLYQPPRPHGGLITLNLFSSCFVFQ